MKKSSWVTKQKCKSFLTLYTRVLLVAQLVEALRYKLEVRGFDGGVNENGRAG